MKKEDVLKSKEFKILATQLMMEEGYDGCDIKGHVETYGLKFKKPALRKEIEARVDFFIKRKLKIKK